MQHIWGNKHILFKTYVPSTNYEKNPIWNLSGNSNIFHGFRCSMINRILSQHQYFVVVIRQTRSFRLSRSIHLWILYVQTLTDHIPISDHNNRSIHEFYVSQKCRSTLFWGSEKGKCSVGTHTWSKSQNNLRKFPTRPALSFFKGEFYLVQEPRMTASKSKIEKESVGKNVHSVSVCMNVYLFVSMWIWMNNLADHSGLSVCVTTSSSTNVVNLIVFVEDSSQLVSR